jgi:pyruvate/2-oxoglutarate/acetoin dehydrogenase E1 component
MREIKYSQALSEGMVQEMEANPDIFITGIAVDYPSGIFGSTIEAFKRFGPSRVFEAPAMENAITGIAIGAAAMGKRPIIVHPRVDFMFLSFDMLLQLAAKWRYMYGGNAGQVPIVVRAVIGRGWGQGATHSQSIQSTLAHFPGLTVVMPATPRDAKGLMISALRHSGPTVILEYRTLYDTTGEVPEESYETELGIANVIKKGKDVSIVATSFMVIEAINAAKELSKHGIDAEVIDLRSIRPLDENTILESVRKTGRLLAVDTSWELCGISSEVSALVAEKAFGHLRSPVRRMGLANCPAPVSQTLESAFYPKASTIANAVTDMLNRSVLTVDKIDYVDEFKGPY